MAIVVAKRQPRGQPHVAHDHDDGTGQPWRKSRNRTLRARSPLDDRWIGVEVSNQVRSGGVLDVVGRRLGHDQPEKPRGRQLGGADHGGRIAVLTRKLFG